MSRPTPPTPMPAPVILSLLPDLVRRGLFQFVERPLHPDRILRHPTAQQALPRRLSAAHPCPWPPAQGRTASTTCRFLAPASRAICHSRPANSPALDGGPPSPQALWPGHEVSLKHLRLAPPPTRRSEHPRRASCGSRARVPPSHRSECVARAIETVEMDEKRSSPLSTPHTLAPNQERNYRGGIVERRVPCRRHAAGIARRAVRSQRSSIRCATADDLFGPVSVGSAVAGTRLNPAPATQKYGIFRFCGLRFAAMRRRHPGSSQGQVLQTWQDTRGCVTRFQAKLDLRESLGLPRPLVRICR